MKILILGVRVLKGLEGESILFGGNITIFENKYFWGAMYYIWGPINYMPFLQETSLKIKKDMRRLNYTLSVTSNYKVKTCRKVFILGAI